MLTGAAAAVAAGGCGSLKVTKIAGATQRPANVAIYVDVHDPSGNAVITDAAQDTITLQHITTAQLLTHQSDLHVV